MWWISLLFPRKAAAGILGALKGNLFCSKPMILTVLPWQNSLLCSPGIDIGTFAIIRVNLIGEN